MFKLQAVLGVILAVGALIVCACAPAVVADMPVRNWKMSVVTGEDSAWTKGARLFADLVRQRSGGRIQIAVYPNSELSGGDQLKELTMLREGSIDFTYHSNLLYSNLDHSFAAISMPWLFTDYAQVDVALSGPAGSQFLKSLESKGIVGLAWGENGFRQLTNGRLAVRTPADLRGLKIRIPDVELYKSIFAELEAVPVMINFGQVSGALKEGLIDGQENPIDIIVSARLYQVQQHVTVWNYSYDAIILGINKQDWDGLTPAARDMLRQAAVEASQEQVRLCRASARSGISLLHDKGMTVTELTAEQVAAFRAATDAVYAEWSGRIDPAVRKLWGSRGLQQ